MTRKVIITAGAAGIGKAIAGAFLAAGDNVYVCNVNAGAASDWPHRCGRPL